MWQLIFKCAAVFIVAAQSASVATVKPVRATDSLPEDVDDPAIWINRADSSKSLLLGTMKRTIRSETHIMPRRIRRLSST